MLRARGQCRARAGAAWAWLLLAHIHQTALNYAPCVTRQLLLGGPLFAADSRATAVAAVERVLGPLPAQLWACGKFRDVSGDGGGSGGGADEHHELAPPGDVSAAWAARIRAAAAASAAGGGGGGGGRGSATRVSVVGKREQAGGGGERPREPCWSPSQVVQSLAATLGCADARAVLFVSGLLCADPAARLTATGALMHPFIAELLPLR